MLTPEYVLATIKARSHVVFDQSKPYNLQIVGFRRSHLASNRFDDLICVVYRDEAGVLQCPFWPATTDPGRYWLDNGRRDGTAFLKAGQYRGCWALGLHKGEKPALVQVKPVTVYRDANKDDMLDKGKEDTGLFGINIHRAGSASTVVDKWSAGCQVFANDADFEAFLELCKRQERQGKGWDRFTYTLVEGAL